MIAYVDAFCGIQVSLPKVCHKKPYTIKIIVQKILKTIISFSFRQIYFNIKSILKTARYQLVSCLFIMLLVF